MALTRTDFDILERFEFDVQPVGIKFLPHPPDPLEKLDSRMAFWRVL